MGNFIDNPYKLLCFRVSQWVEHVVPVGLQPVNNLLLHFFAGRQQANGLDTAIPRVTLPFNQPLLLQTIHNARHITRVTVEKLAKALHGPRFVFVHEQQGNGLDAG